MIKDTGVAARYARALFIITERRGETPQAMLDLRGAWEAMRPGTPAGRLLATPLVLLSLLRGSRDRSGPHHQPGQSFLRPTQVRSVAQDLRHGPGVASPVARIQSRRETLTLMLGSGA